MRVAEETPHELGARTPPQMRRPSPARAGERVLGRTENGTFA